MLSQQKHSALIVAGFLAWIISEVFGFIVFHIPLIDDPCAITILIG